MQFEQQEETAKLTLIDDQLKKTYMENKRLSTENKNLQTNMKELQELVKQLQSTNYTKNAYEVKIARDSCLDIIQRSKAEIQTMDVDALTADSLTKSLDAIIQQQEIPQLFQFLAKFVKLRQVAMEQAFSKIQTLRQNHQLLQREQEQLNHLNAEITQLKNQLTQFEREKQQTQYELNVFRKDTLSLQKSHQEEKMNSQLANQQLHILQNKFCLQNENSHHLNHEKQVLENKVMIYQHELLDVRGKKKSNQFIMISNNTELEDVQKYFKLYYHMIDQLVDMIPQDVLKECLKTINNLFKNNFNSQQELADLQGVLQEIELENKKLINQQTQRVVDTLFQENRKQIEQLRKAIQEKSNYIKENDKELEQLKEQFKYMCTIEERRFKCQLKQEIQLMTAQERISSLQTFVEDVDRNRVDVDLVVEKHPIVRSKSYGKGSITFQPSQREDLMIKARALEEQQHIQQTIRSTRQKLSFHIQNALYA